MLNRNVVIKRRSTFNVALLGLLCVVCVCASHADDRLTLKDVLGSAANSYPKILEAKQKLQQAEAARLTAEGAFDIELQQHSRVRTSGYYSGLFANQKIIKPLQRSNAKVFAEYRYADGEFPVYEDEFVTLEGGEISLGVSFSLLRDGDIDEYRLALANADLNIEMEKLRQSATLNNVQFEAALAYLDWFNAHRQLEVYESLLETALQRQALIKSRIKLGDLAQIELLDNEQNMLKREAQVLKAKNDLKLTSIKLSMYWRDMSGQPKMPSVSDKPSPSLGFSSAMLRDMDGLIRNAIANHPDIRQLENVIAQTENKNSLNRNQLLPSLDVYIKAAQDIGAGSETRDGLESLVGIEISMPLERRKAKGKLAQTKAKLRELKYMKQRLTESLTASLQQAEAKYLNALAQADVSARIASIAQALQEQEQQRFIEGESNVFLLNVREQSIAEAKINAISDELQHILAAVELIGRAYKMDSLHNQGN